MVGDFYITYMMLSLVISEEKTSYNSLKEIFSPSVRKYIPEKAKSGETHVGGKLNDVT